MADEFAVYNVLPDHPGGKSEPITPNNSTDLAEVSRGLWVGVGGTITMRLADDTADRVFLGVAAGEHPFRVKRLSASGTTATDMLALY